MQASSTGIAGRRRGWCLLLAVGLAWVGAGVTSHGALRVRETPWFDLVAPDTVSLDRLAEIAEAGTAVVSQYWELPERYLPPIRVDANPDFHPPGGEPPVRVGVNAGNRLHVELAWSADLGLADVARAMADALLLRQRLWLRQEGAPPPWAGPALAEELEARLRPGIRRAHARALRRRPLIPLEILLQGPESLPAETAGFYRMQAACLGAFLLEKGGGRRAWGAWVLQAGETDLFPAGAGETPAEARLRAELEWAVWYEAELARRLGPVSPPAASRRDLELLRLAVVGAEAGATREMLALDAIAASLDHPEDRALLEHRLRHLKWLLPRINALYFNPAHSLGRVLEAAIDRNPEALARARQTLESDWAQALALEAAITERLETTRPEQP